MSDRGNSRLRARRAPTREAGSPDDGSYTAYLASRGGTRSDFEIRYRDEKGVVIRETIEYAYVLRKRLRGEEEMQLFCTDCRVVLYGKHLGHVWQLLRDHTLDWIQVYDAKHHKTAPEESEVQVTEMVMLPVGGPIPEGSGLVGSIDGPSDLGSNPKYIEGYGQDSMS